jgi:hypothetical protein
MPARSFTLSRGLFSPAFPSPPRHRMMAPMKRPDPTKRGSGLTRLNEPRPVRVRTDVAGVPVAVRQERPTWTPVAVQEEWRIDDEWWRGDPVSRHYYVVVSPTGAVVRIFRDLVGGGWFRQ